MALCQNISGTVKEEDKLTQNVSGVLKTLVSFKQSVNGTLKELLSKKLIASGTLIVGWQAFGNASITSQTGETVTATLFNTSTNISAACDSKISSSSFYAEAGTEFTLSMSGMSPSGPLSAYLIDEDGNVWGRGAVDTKASLFCELQAMDELIEEGFVPECDVYLASSCTEEWSGTGAPTTAKYLKEKGEIEKARSQFIIAQKVMSAFSDDFIETKYFKARVFEATDEHLKEIEQLLRE